jgi:nitrite reductase (NADH) small subunit
MTSTWHVVCPVDRVPRERGIAALVEGTQIALFRLDDTDQLFALGNVDPFSGVGCLSRGLVGDVGGEPMVASPLHKQRFSLRTGECLDDPTEAVPVFDVRLVGDVVEVRVQ